MTYSELDYRFVGRRIKDDPPKPTTPAEQKGAKGTVASPHRKPKG